MEPFRTHAAVNRGVTLIELLVVAAIITILALVMVIGQGSFNKSILLTNTAYDVALTVRSAQTFGFSNRAVGVPSNTGFGVHFASVPSNSFLVFGDSTSSLGGNCRVAASGIGELAPDFIPGDCIYDPNTENASAKTYTLGNGMTISDFCVYQGATKVGCKSSGLTSMDVVFARPNTKALISESGGGYANANSMACIKVVSPQSPAGTGKYIYIQQTGQINVSSAATTACP